VQILRIVIAAIMIPTALLCAPARARGGAAAYDAGPQSECRCRGATRSPQFLILSDAFLLRRNALTAHYPHRELRHQLRHPTLRGFDSEGRDGGIWAAASTSGCSATVGAKTRSVAGLLARAWCAGLSYSCA